MLFVVVYDKNYLTLGGIGSAKEDEGNNMHKDKKFATTKQNENKEEEEINTKLKRQK